MIHKTQTKYHTYLIPIFIFGVCGFSVIGQGIYNPNATKTIKIHNEKKINTSGLEMSPSFVGDKIGYVYTPTQGKIFDKSINETFFELAISIVNDDNSLHPSVNMPFKIKSDVHKGPMTYDLISNKLLFTQNLSTAKPNRNNQKDTLIKYLRIMSADLSSAKAAVRPIALNVENYSVAHPTLSADGQMMIYASDKPGGKGNMDLYMAFFDGKEWIESTNLGSNINTSGPEVFPFLLNDSLLVFSSRRENGMGGLDLYVSKYLNNAWGIAELLPQPLNSPYDDFSLIIRENFRSGYFTSNRPGGVGKDDIYRFVSEKPIFGEEIEKETPIFTTVLDKLTLEPIPNIKISLVPLDLDLNNFAVSSYNVDMLSGRNPDEVILKLSPKVKTEGKKFNGNQEGFVQASILKSKKYLITAEAKDYFPLTLIYDYSLFGENFNMVLEPAEIIEETKKSENQSEPERIPPTVEIPKEKGKTIVFDNIFYEYGSANIVTGSEKELQFLAIAMKENPSMRILLEAHTDSRGAQKFNYQLSINRANAARNYLVNTGINEDRINIKGYGESKLRNKCKDNVPCSDGEHAFNRRTEVVILE